MSHLYQLQSDNYQTPLEPASSLCESLCLDLQKQGQLENNQCFVTYLFQTHMYNGSDVHSSC